MKRTSLTLTLLLALTAVGSLQAFPAVEDLIRRRLPNHADQIVLRDLPAPVKDAPEMFAYETKNGKLILEGNTPVAQASALGRYLRHTAKVAPFWEGFDADRLPAVLPAAGQRVEQTTPFAKRVYFNYCTLSYSCAFWDWKRWEYEIDLMALMGINMPLQPVGLEGVWYRMLQRPEIGFTEAEAREFLVGPAYFAWQWMTNIERFGGPLPKAFIDSHIDLGRRITERELAFGMTPIQQGFTGFVPRRMMKKFPKANIRQQPPWCGSFFGSAQLDPLDPLFKKLAKLFYAEQKALFGAHGYYGTDPFHESAPPRPGNDYLTAVGKTIYEAAVESDPNATLCMQSWSIRMPILKAIPREHALVLDIGGRWRGRKAFEGYPFVIGTIHNFGGRTRLFGNLRGTAENSFYNTKTAAPNCIGMGLFPEGIQNNPACFAMIFEQIWHNGPTDFTEWMADYIQGRYGTSDEHVTKAWALLNKTVHSSLTHGSGTLIAARPMLNVSKADPNWSFSIPYSDIDLLNAWEELLKADPVAHKTAGYRFDVVDVGRQLIGDWLHGLHADVGNAYLDGDIEKFKAACARFVAVAEEMDALCSTQPLHAYQKWVEDARAMEGSEADKNLYEFNATCQITQWGHTIRRPRIFEYAWKEWGGLIADYYLPRWKMLHAKLLKSMQEKTMWPDERKLPNKDYGRPTVNSNAFYKAMVDFENRFIYKTQRGYAPYREGDPVAQANRFLAKWGKIMRADLAVNPLSKLKEFQCRLKNVYSHPAKIAGTPVWEWKSGQITTKETTVEFDVTKLIEDSGKYEIEFRYTNGRSRLDIYEVSLLQNGAVTSTDRHHGFTGDARQKNVYTVTHVDPIIGATFRIRARVRCHSASDSGGKAYLRAVR